MDGIKREFDTLDLGDKRLERRARLLIDRLSEDPRRSIPCACKGWAEVQAAYRFLNAHAVTAAALLGPHISQTEKRLCTSGTTLCIQGEIPLDFPQMQFSRHSLVQPALSIGTAIHPLYAVTSDRRPLGLLDCWRPSRGVAIRNDTGRSGAMSSRCLDGYKKVAELSESCKPSKLVYVCFDTDYADSLLQQVYQLNCPVDFLLKTSPDHIRRSDSPLHNVPDILLPGEHTINVHNNGDIRGRNFRVRLIVRTMHLRAPGGSAGLGVVNVLLARDIGSAHQQPPFNFDLLTNIDIRSSEDALKLIEWHNAYQQIVVYSRLIKEKCLVEGLHLKTTSRLEPAVALYLIVAWWSNLCAEMDRTGLPTQPADAMWPKAVRTAQYQRRKNSA